MSVPQRRAEMQTLPLPSVICVMLSFLSLPFTITGLFFFFSIAGIELGDFTLSHLTSPFL
jgi:hypothetical protein